jgi:hypothetical protein
VDPLWVLLGVAVPALLAGTVLLAKGRAAGSFALALAVLAGVLITFRESLSSEVAARLAFVALAATPVGAIPRPWIRLPLLAVVSALAPAIVLYAVPHETLSVGQKLGWGTLEAAIVAASAISIDLWAARWQSFTVPISLWGFASGGSAAVLLGHYLGGALLAGAVAAGLGALAVLSWWRPSPERLQGAVPVVATVLAGVWLCSYHFADLPAPSGFLLGLAPLGVWVGELTKRRWLTPIALLVPVAVAIALSAHANPSYSGE